LRFLGSRQVTSSGEDNELSHLGDVMPGEERLEKALDFGHIFAPSRRHLGGDGITKARRGRMGEGDWHGGILGKLVKFVKFDKF